MDEPAAFPTSAEITSTAGPLLIGALITWLLMGIYIMQAHSYFRTYKDPCSIHLLVLVLTALEFIHWILATCAAWFYLVKAWGDPSGLLSFPKEVLLMVASCGLTSMLVQTFYCWRIWMMAYDNWLLRGAVVLIEGCSLAQGILSMIGSFMVLPDPTIPHFAQHRRIFDAASFGSLVANILISTCMLCIIFRSRNNGTKLKFNQLICIIVKTGWATSILVATTVALAFNYPSKNYSRAIFDFVQTMYAISVLTNLNAREGQRQPGAEGSIELNLSEIYIQTSIMDADSRVSYNAESMRTPAHSLRAPQKSFRSSITKPFSGRF
ncbi:hypothetical protein B0H15DRAFT_815312 [Mycena belliarum]|uniref:DUF6534 domain-containing protein n=1 Tax=Mycena belliarum TaxID=1033014 RepID=A0AAD6UJS1_9AGAR|nr:hypothetical protein B0H15DRAFT_815312 [Mycena belliae]